MNKIAWLVKKYRVLLLICVLAAGAFYWYEWRPTQIKRECTKLATEKILEGGGYSIDEGVKAYNILYTNCSRERGL